MSSQKKLKSIIESFKFDGGAPQTTETKHKVRKTNVRNCQYKDLAPSLARDLQLIFVGYNPGVQSSVQQHHYAHFTNLFWKLLNESQLFTKVLTASGVSIYQSLQKDELLKSLVTKVGKDNYNTSLKPLNDFEIVKYKIGFTDLVLRCTRTAQELTSSEKLANVPRLLTEFGQTKAKFVVFVGKGIWEIIVKYFATRLSLQVKLTKTNFHWGKQSCGESEEYRKILQALGQEIGTGCAIYVFPNTSGLVTSLSYQEKLQLWIDLGNDILLSNT